MPYYFLVRDPDIGLWEPTEHASWKHRVPALEFCENPRRLTGRRYRAAWAECDEHVREESDG